ncbi:glycosyltransferase [Oceanobacillus bengalensis]|uniref:Glycosyltransferase n=1 Tax=Oceanobacillus bengalensis TaxID=1435466 RepID=A0A494YSP8_9BACI|nr:glycosyltransferase [Oceanobacillus bengalensis]RKQ12962.1 glycosyltransferase [Oceanobacillus bengalensis]
MEHVKVLLSTFNGERYLNEQIESIINQVGVKVDLLVRDDGSSDKTREILSEWERKGYLTWYDGPNMKPANSFLDLIFHASPDVQFYAFCDQDDVWDKDKLKIAVEYIKNRDSNKPSLYYSKLNPVNESLQPINVNYRKGKDSLGRAMLVSYAAGCTMVFDRELFTLARKYKPKDIRMHDHWIYLICIAVGGNIIFDTLPHIKYRQHSNNSVGYKAGKFKQILRLWESFSHGNRERSKQIIELNRGYSKYITEQNLALVNRVINYGNSWKDKFQLIFDKDIKTGSIKNNVLLIIAIVTNRF